MSYIEDNLMPNERVLFKAHIHPAIFLPSVISFLACVVFVIYIRSINGQINSSISVLITTGVFISIFFFLYSIWLGLKALIILMTSEFGVTNRRVIAKTGFIRRHTVEILLSKIESISVNQNVLGRLFNFGAVTVVGTGGTKESFSGISDPIVIRKKINQIVEGYMQAIAQSQQQKSTNPLASG
jgi:uncharacterized membrane protein YdbT with pleckstrin-like domain